MSDLASSPPRPRASLTWDAVGTSLTVRVRGEIDHHTSVAIRGGIDALLFERRPARLRLDLSAVSFMDSSGLGLIMGRLGVMRELGGELAVFHPSRETRRIIALAGMERLVQIEYAPDDPPSSTASDIPGVPDGKTSGAGDASERVVVCTRRRGTSAPRPRRPRATPKTTIRKEKDA